MNVSETGFQCANLKHIHVILPVNKSVGNEGEEGRKEGVAGMIIKTKLSA
jgi:hypothetical protein